MISLRVNALGRVANAQQDLAAGGNVLLHAVLARAGNALAKEAAT